MTTAETIISRLQHHARTSAENAATEENRYMSGIYAGEEIAFKAAVAMLQEEMPETFGPVPEADRIAFEAFS